MFLKLDGNYFFPTFYQISEKFQAYFLDKVPKCPIFHHFKNFQHFLPLPEQRPTLFITPLRGRIRGRTKLDVTNVHCISYNTTKTMVIGIFNMPNTLNP